MCAQIIIEMFKQTNAQMFVCVFEQTNISTKKTFNHSIGRLSQSLFCLSEYLMVRYG